MRKWALTVGAACAVLLTAPVGAQNNGTISGTATMPGQVVSTFSGSGYGGQASSVGQQFPAAAPQAGQTITGNQMMRPYDPSRPFDVFKGTNIDPNSVLAPLTGPNGEQYQPPDALAKFIMKIQDFFTLNPAPPRPTTYTPGIARRNRQRLEDRMWRRD